MTSTAASDSLPKPVVMLAKGHVLTSNHLAGNDEGTRSAIPEIAELIGDPPAWDRIVNHAQESVDMGLRELRQIIEKDLYVTEAIRHAVAVSTLYPDMLTMFKGGTSLAKAHRIVNRFSEDVDVSLVPPNDGEFGASRRKKAAEEVIARIRSGMGLHVEAPRRGSNFRRAAIEYTPTSTSDPVSPTSSAGAVRLGEVLVEITIRSQPPNMAHPQTITSLAGQVADPEIIRAHPILQPFDVLTADPIISVVDKLDALHWRAISDNPEQVAGRVRDVYDLARLLTIPSVLVQLDPKRTAAMHTAILQTLPPGLADRSHDRPANGFAYSPAFTPGHPACEALRHAYSDLYSLIYADEDWFEFDDALSMIRSARSHI